MEHEFDPEGWIAATVAEPQSFAENALFKRIYDELAMRERSWVTEGISTDKAVARQWHEQHLLKTLDAYRQIVRRLRRIQP